MKKTVLVIQEDLIVRKIIERLILSLDLGCISISSLYDLNVSSISTEFEVVITDILFDGVGPLEFAVQLQEAISLRHLFIITNMGQEPIRDKILEIKGVDGFFGFPVDLEAVKQELLQL